MSGSITQYGPRFAVASDVYKPWWGPSAITSVVVDVPEPGAAGAYVWLTGYTVGGWLNPQSMTITGSVAGSISNALVRNFGVDQYGNFAMQIPTQASAGTYTVRDNISTNQGTTGASQLVTAFSPAGQNGGVGPTTGQCMFQWDAADPYCIGLSSGGPQLLPPVTALYNKLNSSQFLTAGGTPLPTMSRLGNGKRCVSNTLKTVSNNTFTPNSNWYYAINSTGNNNGLNALISYVNGSDISKCAPITVLAAFRQVTGGGASYGSVCFWGQSPYLQPPGGSQSGGGPVASNPLAPGGLETVNWHLALRWNSASGAPFDVNGNDANSNSYLAGNASTLPTANYQCTALLSGVNVTCRLNGAQTGTGTITPGTVPMLMNMMGLGVNNSATVTPPPPNFTDGVPFTFYSSFHVYAGLLSGADLTNAEAWVAASGS